MNQITIAVLITCHNRKAKTLACLHNLYMQEGLSVDFLIDVYLTDDGSTDGTAGMVQLNFPSVHVIHGTGNLYWNRGMRLAWERAQQERHYDFFLWLNDDVILFPNAIQELLHCCSKHQASLVCGAFKSAHSDSFTYGCMDLNGRQIVPNGKIQHGSVVNGNAVLANQQAFLSTGMLDAVFPHGIGDHDYGLRLIRNGGQVTTTREYIGFCEKNERLPKWCYSSTPLKERLRVLYSPLGNAHPLYFFIYERRHFGLFTALKHFFSIHLRVLIPSLWK